MLFGLKPVRGEIAATRDNISSERSAKAKAEQEAAKLVMLEKIAKRNHPMPSELGAELAGMPENERNLASIFSGKPTEEGYGATVGGVRARTGLTKANTALTEANTEGKNIANTYAPAKNATELAGRTLDNSGKVLNQSLNVNKDQRAESHQDFNEFMDTTEQNVATPDSPAGDFDAQVLSTLPPNVQLKLQRQPGESAEGYRARLGEMWNYAAAHKKAEWLAAIRAAVKAQGPIKDEEPEAEELGPLDEARRMLGNRPGDEI